MRLSLRREWGEMSMAHLMLLSAKEVTLLMKTYKYEDGFIQAYVKGLLYAGILVGGGLFIGLLAVAVL